MGIDIHNDGAAQPVAGAYVSRAKRLDFGRRERSPRGPKVRVMAALLSCVVGMAWWSRESADPTAPVVRADEILVEVRGEVPTPGVYTLSEPVTVQRVVAKAGGTLHASDGRLLSAGAAVVVSSGQAFIQRMEDPLVVGLPLELNSATQGALQALPGVGATRAAAIVEDRMARGPFGSVDELERVHGIGPKTLEALRPFVVVQAPSSSP